VENYHRFSGSLVQSLLTIAQNQPKNWEITIESFPIVELIPLLEFAKSKY
jgi:hypothetical protein